jgi:hypothetical protein
MLINFILTFTFTTFYYDLDPEFSNETSGCTAVSALITEDLRLLVVSDYIALYRLAAELLLSSLMGNDDTRWGWSRPMQEIHAPCSQ